MGHAIDYYTTKVGSEKQLKIFLSEITEHAYDPQETSSYHGNITIHKGKVYKDYDAAVDAIRKFDNGWYDDHVVMYYDTSAVGKKAIDEWNKKRDNYILAHSIKKRTSKYIGCSNCGSKLSIDYLHTEKCPLCNTDLRPESTIEKIKWYDKKVKECKEKYKEKYWVAKVEYHC